MPTYDEATFDRRLTLVEEAIGAHGAYIEAYCRGLTKNHEDGQDLASELWMHVLHRFKPEDIGKLGYLRRKAWQLWVDQWRKRQRDPVTAVEEVPEIPVSDISREPGTPEEEAAFKEQFFSEEFPDVDLTDNQRDALWLHAREGHSFKAIAEIMGKPSSTVGDWIAQARKLLAEAYNKR